MIACGDGLRIYFSAAPSCGWALGRAGLEKIFHKSFNNIFKCIEDEQNLTEESKETFTNIVFSNLRIYSRYKVIIRT